MQETWYILESGDVADPAHVVSDDKGLLYHKDGVAVAMRGDVPSTKGVDADAERAKYTTRELTADKPKRAYNRRAV